MGIGGGRGMASGLYPQDLRGRSFAASEDDASQLQLCRTLVRTDVNAILRPTSQSRESVYCDDTSVACQSFTRSH